jgi:DNA-binding CsgD family transcriptional regulator
MQVNQKQFADAEIQGKFKKKLQQLRDLEKDLPGIFIVHSFPEFSVVYMSQRGLDILGVSLQEITLSNAEYHERFFNKEDAEKYVPKILGLIERNNCDEMITFFQQVRPSPDHEWVWYLSSMKIFLRDKEGNPLLTLTMSVPIDSASHITTKVERLLQENNFLHKNQHIFSTLTKREKEILKLMALGLSSIEIAAKFHISQTTVMTHRRNIRTKLNAQNNYDVTRFAQAFDLI